MGWPICKRASVHTGGQFKVGDLYLKEIQLPRKSSLLFVLKISKSFSTKKLELPTNPDFLQLAATSVFQTILNLLKHFQGHTNDTPTPHNTDLEIFFPSKKLQLSRHSKEAMNVRYTNLRPGDTLDPREPHGVPPKQKTPE